MGISTLSWQPTGPVAAAVAIQVAAIGPVAATWETRVAVDLRPSLDATMQLDFIHSASAIGTWTVYRKSLK